MRLRGNSRYFDLLFFSPFCHLKQQICCTPNLPTYHLPTVVHMKQPVITGINRVADASKLENLFILKMEQQERNLLRVCVKLATPVFCLLHTVSCRNAFTHTLRLMFSPMFRFRVFTLLPNVHTEPHLPEGRNKHCPKGRGIVKLKVRSN